MRRSVLEPVVLSDDERETLERWARRPKSAQALALALPDRAGLRRGRTQHRGRRTTRMSIAHTVGKWRRRFLADRLDGLHDEPRPGAPRTIADDDVEAVIVKTLEETPVDATHWSTRSMAKATGMSQSARVSRIWRAFGLKPHLVDTFKLSPRPALRREGPRHRRSLRQPARGALVLCVDEKTQVQALDRTAPVLPLRPGLPERRTHDYVRDGTTNLYAALDVASGQVIADMTERHRAEEFRRFLNLINRSVPDDLDVHLVVDNVSTHKTPEIHRWLLRHPRFHLHFTPDLQLVDEPRRALVRRAHQQVAAPGHAPLDQRARGVDHELDRPAGTKNPSPSSGTRAPTRSSTRWPTTAPRISDSGH